MLVAGFSYIEIERQMALIDPSEPAPRRSISNHKDHLDYEEEAIRRVIEKRAEEQGLNVETATERLIQNQAYLDVVIQKGFQALVEGNIAPDTKDVFKAIELKDKFEKDAVPWTLEKIRAQHNAFLRAVKEIVPVSLLPEIIARARDIYENGEHITDADVVSDTDSTDGAGTLELSASGENSPDGEESGVSEPVDSERSD